jgi:hypothetical protein
VKRSTWVAVLATAVVLVAAGNLPRLPLATIAASWSTGIERTVAAWPRLARRESAPAPRAVVYSLLPAAGRPARRPLIAVAPARLLATPAPLHRSRERFELPSLPSLPLQVVVPAIAGVLAGVLALAVLGLALRRDRRGHVWQLARRGMSSARIACTARVPQDAVRTLLTPGLGARR